MEKQYIITIWGQGQRYWNTKHSNSVVSRKVGGWKVVHLKYISCQKKSPRESVSLEKMPFYHIEAKQEIQLIIAVW